MPYSAEINDITLMVSHHHESDVLLKRTADAFDRLYEESAESTRVLAIGVHPYVTGAAHRIKYFEQFYDYINQATTASCTGPASRSTTGTRSSRRRRANLTAPNRHDSVARNGGTTK